MSQKYMYLCSVPEHLCTGGRVLPSPGCQVSKKGHTSPADAFRCYAHYLKSQGWTQIGGRDFQPPDGGPVRILSKKSRFGARLRLGKEKSRHMYQNGKGMILTT